MNTQVLQGLLVPFLGTTLGAALVFFLKRDLPEKVQKGLSGFAAGVMVAASIWSLLIPALEGAADLGAWSFLPATIGFWLGILFLLLLWIGSSPTSTWTANRRGCARRSPGR